MSEALGVHAHPAKKLGKRRPSRRRTIDVGAFLNAAVPPPHPADDPAPVLTYPMDRNDEAGVCVVAGLDHALQTIAAELGVHRVNWTDDQILGFYQTQNPGFKSWADAGGPDDQGMDIQAFLEHLVQVGELVAFGAVDYTNVELMKAATYVGMAIVTGEDLRVAQQKQKVWDYSANSGDWGGHCTTTVAYSANPDRQVCVTWGALQPMTEAFATRQVGEAWFILTKDMLAHPYFRDNFDLPGFAAAVSALTGGKVVVPTDGPVPAPPTPAPGPADPLADFPRQLVKQWFAHSSHTHVEGSAKQALKAWVAEHQV